jgi:hypothetical protein
VILHDAAVADSGKFRKDLIAQEPANRIGGFRMIEELNPSPAIRGEKIQNRIVH